MVSNFGVSFKLRDTREVPEASIGSWRRSGRVLLPQGERANDHRLSRVPCRAMDGTKSRVVVYP